VGPPPPDGSEPPATGGAAVVRGALSDDVPLHDAATIATETAITTAMAEPPPLPAVVVPVTLDPPERALESPTVLPPARPCGHDLAAPPVVVTAGFASAGYGPAVNGSVLLGG
jgi:hypothetical protein